MDTHAGYTERRARNMKGAYKEHARNMQGTCMGIGIRIGMGMEVGMGMWGWVCG